MAAGELGEHRRGRSMEAHGRNVREWESAVTVLQCEEKLQGQPRACGHFLPLYNMGQKVGQARILSVWKSVEPLPAGYLILLEVRSGSLSEILNKSGSGRIH